MPRTLERGIGSGESMMTTCQMLINAGTGKMTTEGVFGCKGEWRDSGRLDKKTYSELGESFLMPGA
jgi:hypothetical protein